jgi:membrane protein
MSTTAGLIERSSSLMGQLRSGLERSVSDPTLLHDRKSGPFRNRPDRTGRHATSPFGIPAAGWKQIARRTWCEANADNIGLVAAGVAFYGFLALVPLLGAIVLSYGIVANPQTVIDNMRNMTAVMPAEAAKLVGEQLLNVVQTSDEKKGVGVLLALAIALFGARNGAGAVVTALNIAYEEEEKRSFMRVNLLAIVMTGAAVVVAIVAMAAVALLGHLESLLPQAPAPLVIIGKIFSYLVLALVGAAGAATLYRFGPSREKARWIWLTPGSALAAGLWLVLTLGFGVYAAHFGRYSATYGSLSAVVVFLTWLYLSSYVLLFGAELNSELEKQTTEDTTDGAPVPMEARGAWAADHLAEAEDPAEGEAAIMETDESARELSSPLAPSALVADYISARSSARAAPLFGFSAPGPTLSMLSMFGLAMLRKKGGASKGIALLAAATGIAWMTRQSDVHADGEPD